MTITQSGTFVADFNQDGAPDVIFQDQTSGWAQVWYLGGPKGITITNAANLTLQNKWRIVGVADFNQDGKPDILWQDTAGVGTVQLWSMGGSNGNQITNAVNIIPNTPTRVVAVADFDLDGHPDLALQDPATGASTISFFGGVSGTTSLGTARLSGNNPWKIAGRG